MQVSFEELKKIPYLDHPKIGPRTIPSSCFFIDGKWKMWIPTEQGLVYVEPVDSFEIAYFAKERASTNDLYLGFLDLFYQHASFPHLVKPLEKLVDDLQNIRRVKF